MNQTTLRGSVTLEGVGLHTGEPSRLTLKPAPPNAGVRFFRADLDGAPAIPARFGFVVETTRGTTLGLGNAKVHTVEHVLSALAGLGVDNADVELTASEPPAMDGSALPFAKAVLSAGILEQDAPKRRLALDGEVRYEKDGTTLVARPAPSFELSVTLLTEHPLAPRQSIELRVEPEAYMAEIAGARTFCFEHELEALRRMGLAKGGSLDNAIVLGKDGFLTGPEGLRFPNELARHKALDLIGDLALLGRSLLPIRVEAVRCGHAHNVAFAALLDRAARRQRRPDAVKISPKEDA